MLLTLGLGALIGGIGGALIKGANQYGTNAQQYEQDKALKQQQFEFDSALSAQNAKQELEKQMQQQEFDKMMSDTENQRKVADMKAAGINPALATGGISTATGTGAQQATATQNAPSKTTARQTEREAKQEILATLATAYQSGVLKVATKKIGKMSEALAKNPKNNNLKNNLKGYIFKTYNLLK